VNDTSPAGVNWAGNVAFTAPRFARPTSLDELAELVRGARHVRAVGSRHTFTALADSADLMVSVQALPGEVTVDAGAVSYTHLRAHET